MAGVSEHYEKHLAQYYAWISGGVELKIEENQKFFNDHNIQPSRSALAFDLGAGCGFQSVPLARLGFRVLAMDLSAKMLAQLKKTAENLPIKAICDDLTNFTDYESENIELVVCMGDTLTHLDSLNKVESLLDMVFSALETGGRLILSFRDLTQELLGLDRFIPVKSNETTIFTCFLEFEKDIVKVNDIIYEKNNDQWLLKKSAFQKLRISPDWAQKYLKKIGFKIEFYDEQNGLIFIIAHKTQKMK